MDHWSDKRRRRGRYHGETDFSRVGAHRDGSGNNHHTLGNIVQGAMHVVAGLAGN